MICLRVFFAPLLHVLGPKRAKNSSPAAGAGEHHISDDRGRDVHLDGVLIGAIQHLGVPKRGCDFPEEWKLS